MTITIISISCDRGSTTYLEIENKTNKTIHIDFYENSKLDKSLNILSKSIENLNIYPMIGDGAFFKFEYDSVIIIGLSDTRIVMYPDSTSSYKSMYNKDNWIFKDNKKDMYTYTYIFN